MVVDTMTALLKIYINSDIRQMNLKPPKAVSKLGGNPSALPERMKTMTLFQYSPYFGTLYDEQSYHGNLGRGTHYSVLQCAEFNDVDLTPVPVAHIHKFSVVWDEDHDTRVIDYAERLYMKGLFAPVQFIGERKGGVSIILASRFQFARYDGHLEEYLTSISTLAEDIRGDHFIVEIGFYDRSQFGVIPNGNYCGMINDRQEKEEYYLRSIDALWELGTKPYRVPKTVEGPNIHDLI